MFRQQYPTGRYTIVLAQILLLIVAGNYCICQLNIAKYGKSGRDRRGRNDTTK